MAGDRLHLVYGKVFIEQLKIIKNEFIPNFKAHIDGGNMANEPQNKDQYLIEGDNGISATKAQFNKLEPLVDRLLLKPI